MQQRHTRLGLKHLRADEREEGNIFGDRQYRRSYFSNLHSGMSQ